MAIPLAYHCFVDAIDRLQVLHASSNRRGVFQGAEEVVHVHRRAPQERFQIMRRLFEVDEENAIMVHENQPHAPSSRVPDTLQADVSGHERLATSTASQRQERPPDPPYLSQ